MDKKKHDEQTMLCYKCSDTTVTPEKLEEGPSPDKTFTYSPGWLPVSPPGLSWPSEPPLAVASS